MSQVSLHHYSISYIISTDAWGGGGAVYVQVQRVWQVMCFLIEGAICSLWHREYLVIFPSYAEKFLQALAHLLVTFPFTQPVESNQVEISLSHIISSSALRHSHCPRQAEKRAQAKRVRTWGLIFFGSSLIYTLCCVMLIVSCRPNVFSTV